MRKATREEIAALVDAINAAVVAKARADLAAEELRAVCGAAQGLRLDTATGEWIEALQVGAARVAHRAASSSNGSGDAVP